MLFWIIFDMFCVSNAFLSFRCSIVVTCCEMAVLLALLYVKVSKGANIKNRYNQVPSIKFFCVINTFPMWCRGSGVVLDCIDS